MNSLQHSFTVFSDKTDFTVEKASVVRLNIFFFNYLNNYVKIFEYRTFF
jgi:hypothetical protein